MTTSVVAAIASGTTILHLLGDWNVKPRTFKEVMRDAKDHLYSKFPNAHQICTIHTDIAENRDYCCSWYMEGTIKYKQLKDLSEKMRQHFLKGGEHVPVAFQVRPTAPFDYLQSKIPPKFEDLAGPKRGSIMSPTEAQLDATITNHLHMDRLFLARVSFVMYCA